MTRYAVQLFEEYEIKGYYYQPETDYATLEEAEAAILASNRNGPKGALVLQSGFPWPAVCSRWSTANPKREWMKQE